MAEEKRSRWRKLDNAALAFPAATGKKDTRVFRFYCQLEEMIDKEKLQDALDQTVAAYPVFQAVLRKGLFWYYLEHRDLRAIVKPETNKPCSTIYVPDAKKLLFEVTYYRDRINFEVFHALTDGTGAIQFFRELIKNYLLLTHKADRLPDIPLQDENVTGMDREVDSFSKYYSKKLPRGSKGGPRAFQLPGPKVERDNIEISEVTLSVKALLEKSRALGVSMTVYLTAVFLCAIHEEMTERQQRRPVTLMIPINLRNYFPSQSMTNFWGWLEVSYHFSGPAVFEDVLEHVNTFFERELVKERIAMRMNDYIRLEKHPVLRAVPLEIKNLFLQAGTKLGSGNITAIFSNVGIIRMPEPYMPYIRRFGVFTSTDKMQLCTASFGDELVLGFSSKLLSTNIQRNFVRTLKRHGITCSMADNPYPEITKTDNKLGSRMLQWLTFICVTAAVICGIVNLLLTPESYWALFAVGGILCCYLFAVVGYYKRRNILKNMMWQLVFVTAAAIIWDALTGWHRWSVDFVFPIAAMAVLIAMAVVSKARRLELTEYLFYLVMGAGYGLIPFILYIFGVTGFDYLAVICAGFCFLFLVGLGIFRHSELAQEFHKKFRM